MMNGSEMPMGQRPHFETPEIEFAHTFENTHGNEYQGKVWYKDGIVYWVDAQNREWRRGVKRAGGGMEHLEEMEGIIRQLKATGYESAVPPVENPRGESGRELQPLTFIGKYLGINDFNMIGVAWLERNSLVWVQSDGKKYGVVLKGLDNAGIRQEDLEKKVRELRNAGYEYGAEV